MKYFVQTESLGFSGSNWHAGRPSFTSIYSTTIDTDGRRIVVLPPVRRLRRRSFNWNMLLGLVTIFGISAASWAGLALLVSRWLK